ncbi:MAG TPA: DUF4249 domain-containing protein [Microscillaceae bacterium]|jgi:hypothetical protein|nr:DUF4249 domain-containing protein [Microscillaceae bacterium]
MQYRHFVYSTCIALLFLSIFAACQRPVDVKLDTGAPQVVVDGMVTNHSDTQRIRLTTTAAYFDNTPTPPIRGAVVQVRDNAGNTFNFTELATEPGTYANFNMRGQIGRTYFLTIQLQGETYQANSNLKRVPPIDSLTQEFRKARLGSPEGYYLLFWARDLPGVGDNYRFRVFRNGVLFNKPTNIQAWDDENTDGLLFIPPIRNSFNPFQGEPNAYAIGDVVTAEIQSLDSAALRYFQILRQQTTNGGIFSNPISNVPTNISNTNPNGRKAVGFFYATAITKQNYIFVEK